MMMVFTRARLRALPLLGTSLHRNCSGIADRFALLQAERQFDIDEQQLQQQYKLLMAETHPDRHSCSSIDEQEAAADMASQLTDAYAILRAPHLRAVHLLELLGAPLDEDTSGDVLGAGFLMEVMDVRETLEDSGSDPTPLATLREDNHRKMSHLCMQLVGAFSAKDLELARSLTAQLQYLQKIEEEIHARMPVV